MGYSSNWNRDGQNPSLLSRRGLLIRKNDSDIPGCRPTVRLVGTWSKMSCGKRFNGRFFRCGTKC